MRQWPFLDELRKDVASLIEIVACIEQVRNALFVVGPEFDFVKIARVRIQRASSLFVGPAHLDRTLGEASLRETVGAPKRAKYRHLDGFAGHQGAELRCRGNRENTPRVVGIF